MKPVEVGVLFRNNRYLVAPFLFFTRSAMFGMDTARIIAVDQQSTDGTADELRRYGVEAILGKHNIASGRNVILNNRTKGHDLLLMDSDVFFSRNDAILKMMQMLHAGPKIGAVTCKTLSFYTGDIVSGFCCALILDDAIRATGAFDERFKMFRDDSDYQDRMRRLGYLEVDHPEIMATHIWGSTTCTGSEGKRREECLEHDQELYRLNCKSR